nr:MAG TPA: hypothetical protein [Caudoviricetes sp.]
MDAFNGWLTYIVLVLDLLQGLEWLYKKVRALNHLKRHQRK